MFRKVKLIPRSQALLKVIRPVTDRVVLPVPYNPRFPQISKILKKHWSVITQDPRYKRMFPNPPMVSYSRCKNLRDTLVRTKVPPAVPTSVSTCSNRPGFRRCQRGGTACTMCTTSSHNVSSHSSAVTGESWPISTQVSCITENCIYRITCNRQSGVCRHLKHSIGETGRRACDRMEEHRGSITNPGQQGTKLLGNIFNLEVTPGPTWKLL